MSVTQITQAREITSKVGGTMTARVREQGITASGLPAALGELIVRRGTRMTLRVGQVLFAEGDPSTCAYSCISGRIKVFVTTPSGRELLLGMKGPGQAFGELSAIDLRPRSAAASAIERSVVSQLGSDEFLDSLQSTPGLAVVVLRDLADQLRRANARVIARDSESTSQRTANLLLELGEKFQRHSPSSGDIVLPIGQDELASWIGATREATARSLATFRRAGAISTGRQKIVLHGLGALAAMIAGT